MHSGVPPTVIRTSRVGALSDTHSASHKEIVHKVCSKDHLPRGPAARDFFNPDYRETLKECDIILPASRTSSIDC
jgi:hypothetical protein